MFDRFMERTLPLWLLVSVSLAILVAYLLLRAAFRIRDLRSLLDDATRKAVAGGGGDADSRWQSTGSTDWAAAPSRDSRR